MKIFKLLLIVVLSCTFFNCASSGPKFSEMYNSTPEQMNDKGRIYIYRTTIAGAGVQPKVMINGEEAGAAVPKGFFYIDGEPGNYVISTSTEVKRNLSLTLDANQIRYVRLNIGMGFFVGHVYPELVDNEKGESEIQNCRYTGKDMKL